LKAEVDEESRRDAREKERSERVKIAARRPDDGLSAAPLLNGWHGYFSLFWLRLARSSCAFAALVVCTWRKRTVELILGHLVAAQQRFERVHQEHLDAHKFGEDVHLHLLPNLAPSKVVQECLACPIGNCRSLRPCETLKRRELGISETRR
jgi:hypothetical protein